MYKRPNQIPYVQFKSIVMTHENPIYQIKRTMNYRVVKASRGVIDYIRDTSLAVVCLGFYAYMTPLSEGALKSWIQDSDEVLKRRKVAFKSASGGEHSPEHVPEDVSVVKK